MAVQLTNFIPKDGCATVDTDMITKYLNNVPDLNNFKVITMIGPARGGKSSFLNCLVTMLTNKECKPFKSLSAKDSDFKDVTTGVNIYFHKNLALLDIQGIAGMHSEADPIALLYAYYISDIIVLNIDKQLNTQALNLLTPIAAKLQEMTNASKKHKPQLIFRVYDAMEGYDDKLAMDNFWVMMSSRADQVQGIRQAINDLFVLPENKIIWTERPDKSEIKELDSGKVMKFLRTDNNFQESVLKLISVIDQTKERKNKLTDFLTFAEDINRQSGKLASADFDLATKINDEEMRWWIEGDKYTFEKTGKQSQIPDELKTSLSINDCTESTYQCIIVREKLLEDVIIKFNERFDRSPSDIRNRFVKIIHDEYADVHIQNAWKTFNDFENNMCKMLESRRLSSLMGLQFICKSLDFKEITTQLQTIHSSIYSIAQISDLRKKCEAILFEMIVKNLIEQFKDQNKQHKIALTNALNNYGNQYVTMAKNIKNVFKTYVDKLEMDYQDVTNQIIKEIDQAYKITWDDEQKKVEPPSSLFNKVKSWLGFPQEVKTLIMNFPINTLMINNNLEVIISSTETHSIHIEVNRYIQDSRNTLYKTLVENHDEFVKYRQLEMSNLLDDMDKLEINARMTKYQTIKHNNLYAFDYIVLSNINESKKNPVVFETDRETAIVWKTFTCNELHSNTCQKYNAAIRYMKKNYGSIYTENEFKKHFGEECFNVFKSIHNESDNDRRIYLMFCLIDMVMLPFGKSNMRD